ncbi:MAG: cytochrome c biogenesis CcdA family protein [Desulfopila sp.]
MHIQAVASQLLNQIVELLPVGYAFGAGMVSAVNPCGFFLLPVYISLYLGAEQESYLDQAWWARLGKACWVALVVTAGFGLLFGLVGAVVLASGYYLMRLLPWFGIGVGLVFIVLGGWILTGRTVTLPLASRLADALGDFRRLSALGYFLFGLSFGATSLGCTLPVFMAVVGSSVMAADYAESLTRFASYVLGMGTVMLALTVSMALVKQGVVLAMLRRLIPYMNKISAFFLLTAGGYILYYWLHFWYVSGLIGG